MKMCTFAAIMKPMRLFLLTLLMACSLTASAQEESLSTSAQEDSLATSAQKENKWVKLWNLFRAHQDAKTHSKYDPDYIEVPNHPWRVVLRSRSQEFSLSMESEMDEYLNISSIADFNFSTRINPPVAQSLGFFVGYRGLGVSYSPIKLRKKTGTYWSFGTTGGRFGLNCRIRTFSTNDIKIEANFDDQKVEDDGSSDAPITVTTIFLDGYYLFNGRRYSQAAAYNQSVIQRRSCGSFMLGGMIYGSYIDLAENEDIRNAPLIMHTGNAGRMVFTQINLGLGYGYNWVPGRGWLINAMLMPSVSLYSKSTTTYYKYNKNIIDFYTYINNTGSEEGWIDDLQVVETNKETTRGRIFLNGDTRLSVTYNWDRYFLSAFGQFNAFGYKHSYTDVQMYDWYVKISLGVRL